MVNIQNYIGCFSSAILTGEFIPLINFKPYFFAYRCPFHIDNPFIKLHNTSHTDTPPLRFVQPVTASLSKNKLADGFQSLAYLSAFSSHRTIRLLGATLSLATFN
jgi:hypothetical protein